MIDLTSVMQAVIMLCSALLTACVVPLITAKFGEQNAKKIMTYARIGVQAAEQIYGSGTGKEKYEYVKRYLESKGFRFKEDAVQEAIESAVYDLKNYLVVDD